jgi:MFS family permease
MQARAEGPTYRQLIADRRISSVIAAVTIGRLAAGMVPFGMIAVFTAQEKLFWAGASSAAFLVSAAFAGPYKGRLVDRYGAARLVVPMAIAFAAIASLGGLLAASGAALPATILTAAAAVLAPPNSAILRSVWTAIAASDAENTKLHSLDSVVEEATFVVTPLLTSGIWFVVGPVWAVCTGAACALVGTLWFKTRAHALGADTSAMRGSRASSSPDHADHAADHAERPTEPKVSVILSRNGLAILGPMLGLGIAFGALSVGFPAWALERGNPEFSGILLALGSVGGVLGGLVYGRLPANGARLWLRYFAATVILAAAVALVGTSTSIPSVVLASLLTGVSLTPMYIIAFLLVGIAFAKTRHTEVNASIASAYNLGSGVAALAVGAVILKLGIPTTLALVGAVVVVLGATAFGGTSRQEVVRGEPSITSVPD